MITHLPRMKGMASVYARPRPRFGVRKTSAPCSKTIRGVLSVELSTIKICPLTPARRMPSLHHSTNSPTVSSSFAAGTTMLNSTSPGAVPVGNKCCGASSVVPAISVPSPINPVRNLARAGAAPLNSMDFPASCIIQFPAHGRHSLPQRLLRRIAILPAQCLDLCAIEADDRHVPLPTAIAAGEFKLHIALVQPADFNCQLRNFQNGNIIVRRHVEHVVWRSDLARDCENRSEHILHMDIAFSLRSVAQNPQASRVGLKPAKKIVANTMGLSRTHHICQTQCPTAKAEHVTVGGD